MMNSLGVVCFTVDLKRFQCGTLEQRIISSFYSIQSMGGTGGGNNSAAWLSVTSVAAAHLHLPKQSSAFPTDQEHEQHPAEPGGSQ